MPKAIISSPFLFLPTQLSCAMMDEVEKMIKGFGWEVVRLRGLQNIRVLFSQALAQNSDATVVIYAGHGSSVGVCGEEVLFGLDGLTITSCAMQTLNNAAQLKDRIVVALPACETAQQLGPAVVKNGAKAYVGSTVPMFAAFQESEHNYMQDWFDYTLEFYRSLIGSLTAGKSVKEAVDSALAAYQKRCTYYMDLYKKNLAIWHNADYYLMAAKQNRDFVVGLFKQ